MVILCLERRYPQKNIVICRKSNIFPPTFLASPNFWSGYASVSDQMYIALYLKIVADEFERSSKLPSFSRSFILWMNICN